MPTHTLYATLKGNERIATLRQYKLAAMAAKVIIEGRGLEKPSVYLSPTAQITSSNPAKVSINQFITTPIYEAVLTS